MMFSHYNFNYTQTALKLLDSDFADENVRAFAVRVLETLPNQQLENFLLQLTQVIA